MAEKVKAHGRTTSQDDDFLNINFKEESESCISLMMIRRDTGQDDNFFSLKLQCVFHFWFCIDLHNYLLPLSIICGANSSIGSKFVYF